MRAGFQAGDLILAANGEAVPLWMDWVTYVRARPEQTMEVLIERNNVRQSLSVRPSGIVSEGERIGAVGMSVELPVIPEAQQRRFDRGPIEALGASVSRTIDLVGFTFKSIGRMLTGVNFPQ